VSVLPLSLFRRFNQSAEQLASSRSIATFGNGVLKLYGPVPLSIALCGVSLTHPFYLVDDRAVSLSPALGGYDLMKAAHLVLDVPNGLACRDSHSRRLSPKFLVPTRLLLNCRVQSLDRLCRLFERCVVLLKCLRLLSLVVRLLKRLSLLVRRLSRMSLFLHHHRCRQICCRLSRSVMITRRVF